VFQAPWEAQIFALVVQLGDRGLFTWKEWAESLGAVIREAQAGGDPDLGDTYYRHWVKALERFMSERGLADAQSIERLLEEIEHDAHEHRERQLAGGARAEPAAVAPPRGLS
jgi:nitrile hydratase accessory protein